VRSRIFEQRLEDKMALQREAAALAMLRQGADIGTVAKKYSDDTGSAASGGVLMLKTTDLANVPSLKPTLDALQPGQSTADFVRVDDGYYYFKLTSRDATTTKMQYVYVYDPKPELYTAAKREKWFIDSITSWEQQAHVKYNVGSRAT
jgi:parvulin-like peptidyl-prolyl isomerase